MAIDKILSGRELLQLQGDLYHLPRNDCETRIADLIDRLAMGDWIDRRWVPIPAACAGVSI